MAKQALVIGIAKYDNFPNLAESANNAESIACLLEQYGDYVVTRLPSFWSREEEQIKIAPTRELTSSDLENAIKQFLVEKASRQDALVYFSGHGVVVSDSFGDRQAFIAPSNGVAEISEERIIAQRNCISLRSLNALIRQSDLNSLVMLLDCHQVGLDDDYVDVLLGQGIGVSQRDHCLISARSRYETAFGETMQLTFAKAVIKGLSPENADQTGKITADRLFDFISQELMGSGVEPVRIGNGRSINLVRYQPALEEDQVEIKTSLSSVPEQLIQKREQFRISIATHALTDAPCKTASKDFLKFDVYAKALADFIRNEETKKPLTIGIDASWGMGKTSLMHILREKLVEEKGQFTEKQKTKKRILPTVWFNAWKYDQEESLWAALALEILNQVRKQLSLWDRINLWVKLNYERFDKEALLISILKSLLYGAAVTYLGLITIGFVTLFPNTELQKNLQRNVGGVAGILGVTAILYTIGNDLYKRITTPFNLKISEYIKKPDYEKRIAFFDDFEQDFKRVIEIITDSGSFPLVVFIDDLDRCEPPKPVEVIEAINMLLDSEHCAFIIGMDAQVVARSIEAKYKDLKQYFDDLNDPGGLTLGQRFLEKIIQINFRIPRSDIRLVESFVENSLNFYTQEPSISREKVQIATQYIEKKQSEGKTLRQASQEARESLPISEKEVVEAEQEVFAQSFDRSKEVLDAIYEAAAYLEVNPRKIKRFINCFRLQALIANRRGLLSSGIVNLTLLAKWTIISTRYPGIVDALMLNLNFVSQFRQICEMREQLKVIEDEGSEGENYDASAYHALKSKFEIFLTDARIKHLLSATDLVKLVSGMTDSELEALPCYFYLTEITTSNLNQQVTAKIAKTNS